MYKSQVPRYLQASMDWGMPFVVTEDGHIGWPDARARAGDQIAILLGCTTPAILRAREIGEWKIVGSCFIHGYMNDVWTEELKTCADIKIY